MKIVYAAGYGAVDIGTHVFPVRKYELIHDALVASGAARLSGIVEPSPATWDQIALVHAPAYIEKLRSGLLSVAEIAQLEIPWSESLVESFRLMTGGTIQAARHALEDGIAVHLGGGFHHAFPDHGEGFCMFNDVAIAVRVLRGEGLVDRVSILDCDVHHGNGTAAIFGREPAVFTASLHQLHNYPAYKPPGSLDLELPDGATDDDYLACLGPAIDRVLDHGPDLLLYLAGADPYRLDQLGGLGLTMRGLRERDARVLDAARARGVPVCVLLAGGYAYDTADTVAIHVATVEEALARAAL